MNDGAVERTLAGFSGVAKLLPLPDLVFFPHVVAPLRIVEPRYVEMARDALAGDGLIAVASLQPPAPHASEGAPPAIHTLACLARIRHSRDLPNGQGLLLVEGLVRAKIAVELPEERPYRQAIVELLPDRAVLDAPPPPEELGRELFQRLSSAAVLAGYAPELLAPLAERRLSLPALVDLLAYFSKLPTPAKQALLGEPDVFARLRRLLDLRKPDPAAAAPRRWASLRRYPAPCFSPN